MSKVRNIWVVVLAGGDGRRLGSVTTNAHGVSTPKQYCSIDGGYSLLQLALQRAIGLTTRDKIVTVVTEGHRRWWEPELFSWRRSPVVVQPGNRGSGLGVLVSLLVIAKRDPDAVIICIPSDHYVENEEVLAEALRQAVAPEAQLSGKLTLLGMSANARDSGFGYVCPCPDSGVGLRPVERFVEKPDETVAMDLIRKGGVLNTGIVAGRLSQIVGLYPRNIPGLMLDLKSIIEYWPNTGQSSPELASLYTRHPILDFSTDVLATHPEALQLLEVPPCGWSDVGTPTRLAATLWSLRAKRAIQAASAGSARSFNLATALDRVTGFNTDGSGSLASTGSRVLPGRKPSAVNGRDTERWATAMSEETSTANGTRPTIADAVWTRRVDEQ